MKTVIFENVNFCGSNFSNTSLDCIDFSTCNIQGITVYPNDLKGVILTDYQALEFIRLLGIQIKE